MNSRFYRHPLSPFMQSRGKTARLSFIRCVAFFAIMITSAVSHASVVLDNDELKITLGLRQDDGKEIRTIDFDESFEIKLTNVSDQLIEIPDPKSQAGVRALSFTMRKSDQSDEIQITRAPNPAAPKATPIKIAPGKDFRFYVSFSDDLWQPTRWNGLPVPNFGDTFQIVAHYNTREIESEVWAGAIQSDAQLCDFVFERAKLPQQYLWNGFAAAGLRLLKSDPELIHCTDDDKRTPLHVAARFGHQEVTQWLIENGADVNAVAYNKFTPLCLTGDEQIIKLLVKGGADPHHTDVSGQSPLQKTVAQICLPRNEKNLAKIQKSQRILECFFENGVKLDLISAIQIGELDQVQAILEEAPEQMAKYSQSQKPLRTAARFNRTEVARYLLDHYPDQTDVDNFSGNNGYPVLKDALPHAEMVKLLIEYKADLERRITWIGGRTGRWVIGDNATLLHFAARDGTPDSIKILMDHGVSPFDMARGSSRSTYSQSPLEVASFFGKGKNGLAILQHEKFQTNPEAKNAILNISLVEACKSRTNQTPTLIKALVENGADINTKAGSLTLVQSVSRSIHPSSNGGDSKTKDTIYALQKCGAELDFATLIAIQDRDGIESKLNSNPDLAKSRRYDGYPVIHIAASMGDLELVKRLIEKGCDVNIKNHSKNSGHFAERALHTAAFWNRKEVVKLLLDSGADVNAIAQKKVTALHDAARMGNREVIELLLQRGANANAEDIQGRTPLVWCTFPEIKRLLQEHMDK